MSRAEQPLEAVGTSPEGARAFAPSRAEGPPAPLCDTWQQQSEPRRAVASGRSAGRSPVWVVVRVAGCGGYWAKTIVGPRLIGLGRKFFFLGCRPARLDRGSGLALVQLNRNFWAGLRFGPL